jgi:hypothetical protein
VRTSWRTRSANYSPAPRWERGRLARPRAQTPRAPRSATRRTSRSAAALLSQSAVSPATHDPDRPAPPIVLFNRRRVQRPPDPAARRLACPTASRWQTSSVPAAAPARSCRPRPDRARRQPPYPVHSNGFRHRSKAQSPSSAKHAPQPQSPRQNCADRPAPARSDRTECVERSRPERFALFLILGGRPTKTAESERTVQPFPEIECLTSPFPQPGTRDLAIKRSTIACARTERVAQSRARGARQATLLMWIAVAIRVPGARPHGGGRRRCSNRERQKLCSLCGPVCHNTVRPENPVSPRLSHTRFRP